MKRIFLLIAAVIILTQCKKPGYQKEDILVTGTSEPVICLNGTWKFTMAPPKDFYLNDISPAEWYNIKVPGECTMQGFALKHDSPCAYKTSVLIPSDYSGKIIRLKFESTYSYARVWVNGKFIRDHSGGFTTWECDITEAVVPGSEAWITVEITDMDDDPSNASRYAKHQIGGILRTVTLYALPGNYPKSILINSRFDRRYKDADLMVKVVKGIDPETWVSFRFYDRYGRQVRLSDRRFRLKSDTSLFTFRIKTPLQWNAENPDLYTLIVEIFNRSILTASYKTSVGFREIKIDGNNIMVNGRPVKLRGASRLDIHPLLGRVSTPEYDRMDVLLAKEANMNFIRTSHYPPSETFLRYCDEYGIYVEDEAPVCFMNIQNETPPKGESKTIIEPIVQQLSQLDEMVQSHINHPSVIIWSLGNDSIYNEAFRNGYDYLKSVDITRPVIFSYPGSLPDSVTYFDILSLHFPSFKRDISQKSTDINGFSYNKKAVIYDVWAQVACFNKQEILEDMNVRNFWGQGLDSMWNSIYESEAGGGAILGLTDETFMLPDTMNGYNQWRRTQEGANYKEMPEGPVTGYGEWGIADTWRRKKPEFWNTKKAYSPVKILTDEITEFRPGHPLKIPVYNRYNHTNLKDIKTVCRYRGRKIFEIMQNIEPSKKGDIQLPPADWDEGEILNITFLNRDSGLIDEYNLRFGTRKIETMNGNPGEISVSESNSGNIRINSGTFNATFNRKTGLLENVMVNTDTLIKSGPAINYRYAVQNSLAFIDLKNHSGRFIPVRTDYKNDGGTIKISVTGMTGQIKLTYIINIFPDGFFEIDYEAGGFPDGVNAEEFGLMFELGGKFDSLKWDRKSQWNAYPPNHIGSGMGNASLREFNRNSYRGRPVGAWEKDNKSFYYNGIKYSEGLSYLAGSLKENIYSYTVKSNSGNELAVVSDGKQSCRLKRSGRDLLLFIDNFWDYQGLDRGTFTKNKVMPEKTGGKVRIRLGNNEKTVSGER